MAGAVLWVIGIMSDSVAMGHEVLGDNACFCAGGLGVSGPEKVKWQECTHCSASNLPSSPGGNTSGYTRGTTPKFIRITQSKDIILQLPSENENMIRCK